MNLNQC